MKRKLLFLALSLVFITTLLCVVCSADEYDDEYVYYSYAGHINSDYLPLLNDVPVSDQAPWGNLHEKIGFGGVINSDYIVGGYFNDRFVLDFDDWGFGYTGNTETVEFAKFFQYGFLRWDNVQAIVPLEPFEYDRVSIIAEYVSSTSSFPVTFNFYNSDTLEFVFIIGNWVVADDGVAFTFTQLFDSRYGSMINLSDYDLYVYFVGTGDNFSLAPYSLALSDMKILTPRDDIAAFSFSELDESVIETYYNQGYLVGYDEGLQDSDAYAKGYDSAVKDIDDGEFGANFLGNIFSAPFRALNSFVIMRTPNGAEFTLGGLLSCVIVMSLFIGFIKVFGGK